MKNTKNKLSLALAASFLLSLFSSCQMEDSNEIQPESNNVQSKIPPPSLDIPLNITGADFYENIPYDEYNRTKFDIFIPTAETAQPKAIVIFVHGGGFVGGTKNIAYTNGYKNDIQYYINNNIAFATVNYRFKQDFPDLSEEQKVLSCMGDVKRCLQFIRKNASVFNLNKNKVGMYGASAGGGCSIWLGFKDDMADSNATDPVLKQSTRLQAIGHINSQASYSPSRVASIFESIGCDIPDSEITVPELDLIDFMSTDDPDIFMLLDNIPTNNTEICENYLHSPLQTKALYDKANLIGLPNVTYIPYYPIGVDPKLPENESLAEFMKRQLE